jgi:hypothetical protein
VSAQLRALAAPAAKTALASAGAPRVVAAEIPIPMPKPVRSPAATTIAATEPPPSRSRPEDATALLEAITSSVDSGNLFAQRQLTTADLVDYANRSYRSPRTAELLPSGSEYQ